MRRSSDLPPLLSLRAFEAAARLSSFRRAATELAVAQSAVSHHVAQVERFFGARLFVRKARGIEPTPAAMRFLGEIQQAFSSIAAASAKLRAEESRERIRVSLLPSFAANFLVARLPAFLARTPAAAIELQPTLELADVAASAADLAIRYGDGNYPGVSLRCLGAERLVAVASPALLRKAAIRRPADVLRFPLLTGARLNDWNAWAQTCGVDLAKADFRQLTDYNIVLQAAADGQGIAIGRLLLAGAHIKAGRLAKALPHTVVSPRTCYWLVGARHRRFARATAAFVDWLGREFADAGAPARPAQARRVDRKAARGA
jgi:LysR family glycine cleavage system transcriptional activator